MPTLHTGDSFSDRHIGPRSGEIQDMLRFLEVASIDDLVSKTVPGDIRLHQGLDLPPPATEAAALAEALALAQKNEKKRSLIGMGYSTSHVPPVIRRNVFENPGWYTQYTPYQAEISQGRLEAMLNFQTLVADLTGLPMANASMLDEATAAAEGMALAFAQAGRDLKRPFFILESCHPQTLAVMRTRTQALGVDLVVGTLKELFSRKDWFGGVAQIPDTFGVAESPVKFIEHLHACGGLAILGADLLSLCIMKSPGEWGADVAYGSAQRFGVPMGFGGPHAAFFSTREDLKRLMPGRLVGMSRDSEGRQALRLALQTREQHIRREKATSNICTAQVLLAVMASMYAVWHGPEGLRAIANRVRRLTEVLANGCLALGVKVEGGAFDTLRLSHAARDFGAGLLRASDQAGVNLRSFADGAVGVSLDEASSLEEVSEILSWVARIVGKSVPSVSSLEAKSTQSPPPGFERISDYLKHPVFHRYRSETEMLRYLKRLESRDLSLTSSMIPLGSCTMKLNASAEMLPVSEPGFGGLHPFVPAKQAQGYLSLISDLEKWLAEITGFKAISLQPNAGSQGEYAGLLVIRAYHESRGDGHRRVCLIPRSAHGTNPATAAMAGMQVEVVECDAQGNVDVEDLEKKARTHENALAALMITYPSTHGVFEPAIRKICEVVHRHGGQVYMDGANMNAQLGLCRPGDFGADVCHLNLHKTFCIPHGGGGPGMGPIGVAAHLARFLPSHPCTPGDLPGEVREVEGSRVGAVSAAPWGSPSILPISWAYIRMMGAAGLKRSAEIAILNSNYVARRLAPHFPVLYRGAGGFVAHECIIDLRPLKASSGVEVEDVAKRLMDYGFHAPTVSFPVAGTLMIEPTESESKVELDRFCDAMISIREEIRKVEKGEWPKDDNPLKQSPHTASALCGDEWKHPYSREVAAFPVPGLREFKFWPHVARVDGVYGDRNLVCTCPTDWA